MRGGSSGEGWPAISDGAVCEVALEEPRKAWEAPIETTIRTTRAATQTFLRFGFGSLVSRWSDSLFNRFAISPRLMLSLRPVRHRADGSRAIPHGDFIRLILRPAKRPHARQGGFRDVRDGQEDGPRDKVLHGGTGREAQIKRRRRDERLVRLCEDRQERVLADNAF